MCTYLQLGSSFTQKLCGNLTQHSLLEDLITDRDISESAIHSQKHQPSEDDTEDTGDLSDSQTWGRCFSILDQDSVHIPYQADIGHTKRRRSAEYLVGQFKSSMSSETGGKTSHRRLKRSASFCVRSLTASENHCVMESQMIPYGHDENDASSSQNLSYASQEVSLSSDQSSFMHKPMCTQGILEKDINMPSYKKKSLLKKLKSIGKHFHHKCATQSKQFRTLAVL